MYIILRYHTLSHFTHFFLLWRRAPYLDEIIKIHPETVVVVDAVNLGMEAGAVALLEEDSFQSAGWSTHHGSLRPLIKYIKANTKADVYVLGIQPKSTEFGTEISSEVLQTLERLQRLITRNSASRQADKAS